MKPGASFKMKSIYPHQPHDLTLTATYPLASRPSKVTVSDFARPLTEAEARGTVALFDSLPHLLAANSLRAVTDSIQQAKQKQRAIIWGIGGHVIKTGLAPVLIDLMRRGFITAVAMNGSCIVHDFEIALAGWTSEDVDTALTDGTFGMAEETGRMLNGAINSGAHDGIGLGESVGRMLTAAQPEFAAYSLQHAAYAMKVPVTVHVTLGTDILHIHPQADGAAIGAASHHDFKLFASLVRELDGGGVYLNVGSAVTLPEVFLKAITVVRNLGHSLQDFTTANFDFIQHYRPQTNVVRRPVANGAGHGYSLTGHHELMIPLLAAMLIAET